MLNSVLLTDVGCNPERSFQSPKRLVTTMVKRMLTENFVKIGIMRPNKKEIENCVTSPGLELKDLVSWGRLVD